MPDSNKYEGVEYDSEADLYRLRHDWSSDDDVSIAIVEAVAEITNVEVLDIDPLYESIDPDALNKIFEPRAEGEPRKIGGSVTIAANECTVTVYSDGEIEIEPPD